MPLTQEQIDKICRMIDSAWCENESSMAFTKCTICGQARRCITSIIDMTSTCKECYKKKRLKAIETDGVKSKLDLNDFAKL